MSKNKNCGNCGWSTNTPPYVKPYYGYGGMMLACCNPNKRNAKKSILIVAPLCDCAKWKPKQDGGAE